MCIAMIVLLNVSLTNVFIFEGGAEPFLGNLRSYQRCRIILHEPGILEPGYYTYL